MPNRLWQIKWTDAAREDVLQIRLYLQEHFSAAYAAKITQEIRHQVSLLKQHP